MHPIPQQVYKAKTYNRRSESQQMEFEKHEAIQFEEKQKQTTFGEDNVEQDQIENQEFNGPTII
eukprot:9648283-Heterocapsa_arctica.AAC.1